MVGELLLTMDLHLLTLIRGCFVFEAACEGSEYPK